ncbi:MAG: LptA/OstA family protein [Pleurocapsa sp.]
MTSLFLSSSKFMPLNFMAYRQQLFNSMAIALISALVLCPTYSLTAQTPSEKEAITLRSDIQESNSETGVITAKGNVKINYPARQIQATAAQAQYFTRERRLVLTGNVYILQQGNSMRAETMTYLIDEGRFIATPKSDRQVESTYLVTEPIQQNQQN